MFSCTPFVTLIKAPVRYRRDSLCLTKTNILVDATLFVLKKFVDNIFRRRYILYLDFLNNILVDIIHFFFSTNIVVDAILYFDPNQYFVRRHSLV